MTSKKKKRDLYVTWQISRLYYSFVEVGVLRENKVHASNSNYTEVKKKNLTPLSVASEHIAYSLIC